MPEGSTVDLHRLIAVLFPEMTASEVVDNWRGTNRLHDLLITFFLFTLSSVRLRIRILLNS